MYIYNALINTLWRHWVNPDKKFSPNSSYIRRLAVTGTLLQVGLDLAQRLPTATDWGLTWVCLPSGVAAGACVEGGVERRPLEVWADGHFGHPCHPPLHRPSPLDQTAPAPVQAQTDVRTYSTGQDMEIHQDPSAPLHFSSFVKLKPSSAKGCEHTCTRTCTHTTTTTTTTDINN